MVRGYVGLLRRRGFAAFLATQFLGALNDNLYKWTLTFLVLAGALSHASAADASNLNRIAILFILPSLLFSGLAGWLADNFDKRTVLVASKSCEILVMGLAWLALRSGDFNLLLGVLFLLATQFTFFSPAKYSVVPELVDADEISLANGLLEMSTFLAILLGSALAGPLYQRFARDLDSVALILLGLAVLGSALSLGIAHGRTPGRRTRLWSREGAGGPAEKGILGLLQRSAAWQGNRLLRSDRLLWPANLGAAYFWFQGALLQLLAVLLARQVLQLDEVGIARMGMAMAIGVGAGSLLCGRLSGPGIRLAFAPVGALGMALASAAMALAARQASSLVLPALAVLGVCAGFFVVPLNATLQQRAEAGAKGRAQAAANIYSTLAMIAAALSVDLLSAVLGLPADAILLASAGLSLVMAAWLWARGGEFRP